jgi:hypothetical protein
MVGNQPVFSKEGLPMIRTLAWTVLTFGACATSAFAQSVAENGEPGLGERGVDMARSSDLPAQSGDLDPADELGERTTEASLRRLNGLVDELMMELINERPDIVASRRLALAVKKELDQLKGATREAPPVSPSASRPEREPQFVTIIAEAEAAGPFTSADITLAEDAPDTSQYWLAVVPARASDTAWVQGAQLSHGTAARAVQLGQPASISEPEEFLLVVLKAPQGAITREGPIPVRDFAKFRIEQIGGTTVQRKR